MRYTWFDRREATEMGAAGLAILVILTRHRLHDSQGAWTIDEDTGMDYWLSTGVQLEDELTENFLLGERAVGSRWETDSKYQDN